jgi:hypothetical protein
MFRGWRVWQEQERILGHVGMKNAHKKISDNKIQENSTDMEDGIKKRRKE